MTLSKLAMMATSCCHDCRCLVYHMTCLGLQVCDSVTYENKTRPRERERDGDGDGDGDGDRDRDRDRPRTKKREGGEKYSKGFDDAEPFGI